MGTLTRSELVEELKGFFGNRDDITDARYVRWLNLAQSRISRLADWEELEKLSYDTTSNTGDKDVDKFLALPQNTKEIMSVRLISDTESRKLTGYVYKEFDAAIPYPQRYATGKPTIYTHWAGQLELWRIPDAAYRIEIRRIVRPTVFDLSSDNASDLREKDDAILMLAASWGHASLRNNEDARYYWRIYASMINESLGEDKERPDMDIVGFREQGELKSSTPWADPFVSSFGD